jgi:protein tyrosine/serine phosphatase
MSVPSNALVRSRALAFVLAVVAVALPSHALAGPATGKFPVSIANFGQINETYFRGAQPTGHDYADLAALGVKTVIDLTRDGEAAEAGMVEHAGMKFFRIPMTTSDRPADAAVARFLALVNDPGNQPVYVHCQGGRHRTGVMTAVYRLSHDGWSADHAFEEMKQYEFEKGLGHGALKSFVYDFYAKLTHTPALAGAQADSSSAPISKR